MIEYTSSGSGNMPLPLPRSLRLVDPDDDELYSLDELILKYADIFSREEAKEYFSSSCYQPSHHPDPQGTEAGQYQDTGSQRATTPAQQRVQDTLLIQAYKVALQERWGKVPGLGFLVVTLNCFWFAVTRQNTADNAAFQLTLEFRRNSRNPFDFVARLFKPNHQNVSDSVLSKYIDRANHQPSSPS